MNYRLYRLKIQWLKRTRDDTGKVKDPIRGMNVAMDDLLFNGKDTILVSNFLPHFAAEADTLERNGTQAYVAFPNFLCEFALDQYRAVPSSLTVDEGGVTNWPEALQYLLQSYASANAIRTANLALRDIVQKPDEDEVE